MMQLRSVGQCAVLGCIVAAGVALAAAVTRLAAQEIDTDLPPLIAGVDNAPGVTVQSRLRPGYDPVGVRLGSWLVFPDLTETTGYNSNVTGYADGRGSGFVETRGSADIGSQWSRDGISANVTVDDVAYAELPHQSFTDWTASGAGRYLLGPGEASIAYSHQDLHQAATDFAALPSDTPVAYRIDSVKAAYQVPLGPFTLTPSVEYQHFSFDGTTVLGAPLSLKFDDRDLITVGATARYRLSDQRSLLLLAEGIDDDYATAAVGEPIDTSRSLRLLAGLDDNPPGPWRYRVLAGLEARRFAAPQLPAKVSPIAEASVIWTPNGQTTATLALTRTVEDPTDEGVAGYVDTAVRVVIDREMRRNLLFQISGGGQTASYFQGGSTQTNLLWGASLTRLLNPHARLVLSYSYNGQNGPPVLLTAGGGAPSVVRGGNYDRQVVSLALKVGM